MVFLPILYIITQSLTKKPVRAEGSLVLQKVLNTTSWTKSNIVRNGVDMFLWKEQKGMGKAVSGLSLD